MWSTRMKPDFTIKPLSDEARSFHGGSLDRLLRDQDKKLLRDRIHRFQTLDIASMSDKELEAKIDEVLRVEIDGGITISTTMMEYSLFHSGERFYRVRPLKTAEMPNRDLKKVAAFWNPPSKYVKRYGRLNRSGESLLYTALNPYTAICETGLKSGDPFALCVYEAIKPLRFSWIGGQADYEFNQIKSKKAIDFLETIRKFLVDEFTRIVPEGQESLYRITEIIAKNYYNSPEDNGWRYPSIKNNYEDNICFKSERVMYNLKLVGAIIATLNEADEEDPHGVTMSVKYVIEGPNMDRYYLYESEAGEAYMEKLFPKKKPRGY